MVKLIIGHGVFRMGDRLHAAMRAMNCSAACVSKAGNPIAYRSIMSVLRVATRSVCFSSRKKVMQAGVGQAAQRQKRGSKFRTP